nr:TIM barrel protein [Lachnospiraceae bacterium]
EWERVAEEVAGLGLSFPVFHVEKRIGTAVSRNEEGDLAEAARLFEINCCVAERIGAKKLVFHLWDGEPSDRDIRNNIEQYAVLNETAKRHGLLLTVENVVCNRENPLKHLTELHEAYPDIAFTFDVRFAKFHDELELACTDEYRWLWDGAVRHIHIGDYIGGYMNWGGLRCLHPGEGVIDFKAFFAHLKRVGYPESVTLESTSVLEDGSIDMERLGRSLGSLRAWLKE